MVCSTTVQRVLSQVFDKIAAISQNVPLKDRRQSYPVEYTEKNGSSGRPCPFHAQICDFTSRRRKALKQKKYLIGLLPWLLLGAFVAVTVLYGGVSSSAWALTMTKETCQRCHGTDEAV